ncbi:MAG: hypothetical protein J6C26_01565 [Clostridia bacterium]|nr:hypothetical protein [Clostridia bacterium]
MKPHRFSLSLLSLLLLLGVLFGCIPAPLAGGTSSEDGAPEGTTSEELVLIRDGISEYRFVYPEAIEALDRASLTGLISHLKKNYGVEIPMVSDREAPQAKEILFGCTNRQASADAVAGLADEADFSLSVSGEAFVIAWTTSYGVRRAADFLKDTYPAGSEWVIASDLLYVESQHGSMPKPISRFSFEEGTGTTAVDAVTGKTATLVGAGWEEGIFGSGLSLDDSSEGYLDLGKGYFADLCGGKDAVTINLWVMAYQNRSSRLFTLYSDRTVTASYCTYNPGNLYFYVRSTPEEKTKRDQYIYDAGSKYINGTADASVNDGVWQNLTFVMDFAEGEIAFYVNGKEISGAKGYVKGFLSQTLSVATPTNPDALGGDPKGKNFSFCGVLDEFKIYDCRLTEDQIQLLANGYTDRNSPTADQAFLDEICKRLRTDFVVAQDSSLYCSDGMQLPLDPMNPTAKTVVQDGKWYVPEAFARTVFGQDALSGLSPSAHGYDLEALAQKAGKKLLLSPATKTAVISSLVRWSEEEHEDMLARLYTLLTEHSYDLPTTSVETTRVVVADATKSSVIRHCFSPYVIKMGDAIYVTMDTHTRSTIVFRSEDGGKTFQQLSTVSPMAGASLFEAGGALYLLGMTGKETTEIGVTKSVDGGKTWSAITTVPYDVANKYCAPSSVVKANGRIYKSFEGYKTSAWTEDKRTYTVSAPENGDLLNPKSWTISNHYSYEIEDLMAVTEEFYTDKTYIQEGCMVLMADGSLRNVLRIDCYPYYGGAVSFSVSPDGKTQTYDKADPLALIHLPTGGDLFHIEYDALSGYYISLINIKTTAHRPYQRNVLALAVSKDMETWDIVTNLLVDRTVTNEYISMAMHGFQYVSFCFDGEDLLFAVREAGENADNYHDNDLLTFYRLADFRSLYAE